MLLSALPIDYVNWMARHSAICTGRLQTFISTPQKVTDDASQVFLGRNVPLPQASIKCLWHFDQLSRRVMWGTGQHGGSTCVFSIVAAKVQILSPPLLSFMP